MTHACVIAWASVSDVLIWKGSFKGNTGRHGCVGIVPHPMCRRLDYTLAILNICRKWFSMDTIESNAWKSSDGWMFVMPPTRWSTHESVLNGCVWVSQDGRAVWRHGIASRCMSRVVGNQDDNEMWHCCVTHD